MNWYKVPKTSMMTLNESNGPMRVIRYAYYAFIFSLPFEAADIGIGGSIGTLSRLLGLMFVMVALLQPSICFRHPPKAFFYFMGYFYVLVVLILGYGLDSQQAAINPLFTLIQLLGLFWISYNMMRYEQVRTNTLKVLVISCTLLAVMLTLNFVTLASMDTPSMGASTVGVVSQQKGRITAFGTNPNALGSMLALGLLALIGLVFGRERENIKTQLLAWPCLGVLAIALVRTGSRGAVLALMAGLLIFLLKGKGLSARLKSRLKRSRLKIALAAVGVVGFVIIFSFQYEPIRARWERTITEGDTAGRDKINTESFGMFVEKPWLGWGPGTFYFELGSRLGLPSRHPHNLYFWLLLETGLVGTVLFVAGLWQCWRAAWKGRGGLHGLLAAGLLANLFFLSVKTANHKNKLFWIVLAYALASGTVAALPKVRTVVSSSGRTVARILPRRRRSRFLAAVEHQSDRSSSS